MSFAGFQPNCFMRLTTDPKPDAAGVEHRSAALHGKTVAGEVHDVDVGRALRDAFLQDVRAFVHQRIQQAIDDLRVGDLARHDLQRLAFLVDDLVDHRIRNRIALAGFVAIPAEPGLLSETAELADAIGDAHLSLLRMFRVVTLADVPADVVAGQVRHAERAHRETELLDGARRPAAARRPLPAATAPAANTG